MANQFIPKACCQACFRSFAALAVALVCPALAVAQSPVPTQSDLYQNKLRPQAPHRVLQAPQTKSPAATPDSGIAPYIASPTSVGQPASRPHRVLQPYQPSNSESQAAIDELPEYEAPIIDDELAAEALDPAMINDAPNASGPTTTSKPPENIMPFAVTAEHVHSHVLHGDVTGAMPPIPAAIRQPVWKTPYSYGYFGAGRKRQWTLHYGHSQTYTQWTLR